MRQLVVPGLVAVAGFHRRDDMDQTGMVAADGEHLGDDVLLADVVLGNVFDGNAGSLSQRGSAVAHAIAIAVRQIADSRRSGSAAPQETPSFPSHSRPPAACR